MAVNIDLKAPPAFDKSIVPVMSLNFSRIRDAFLHASTQVSFITGGSTGPWPVTANILVPYKCDIIVWSSITYWSSVAGAFIAMNLNWDGGNIGFLEQYFNEANSHKQLSGVFEVRGVNPGNHTLQPAAATGGVQSDANDRWRYGLLFLEVMT